MSAVPTAALLSQSPHLTSVSERALEIARLYRYGPLLRNIGAAQWRFSWRCLTQDVIGVELRVRIGDAQVILGLESLDPFPQTTDLAQGAIPAGLRAAYLNGAGKALWEDLEVLLQRTVEVLEVQLNRSLTGTPDCLGFQIGREPPGIMTRGFLRVLDPTTPAAAGLYRALDEASRRAMPSVASATHFPIQWAAIVGSTTVPAAELQALQEQDVILIDTVKYSADTLDCWLGVGPLRTYAGRALFRKSGELQWVHSASGGKMTTTHPESDLVNPDAGVLDATIPNPPVPEATAFDEIPINVRFELAQWSAPLAEVAGLQTGSIIDLGQRIDAQSVSVWVQQRCIGKGQLVAIGERLGVRLLSVFGARS
jgi:type III secretion protein Q